MRPASLLTTVLLLGACAGASTQTPASAPDPIDVPTEKTVSAPSAPPPSPIPPPADSERRDYPRRPGTPQPTRTAPGAKEPEADASNLPDYPRRISVARPRDFGDEIAAFELTDSLDPQPPGGTLFVGSSTIRLWEGLDESFPGIHVIPRGFGGSQLDDVLHYAPRIVIPYRPRLIVLYAGDNDLAAGRSPTEIFRDYQAFIELVWLTLPTARIAFISIKPSGSRWALVGRMRETNAMIRRFAASDPRLLYVDVFNPMLGPDGRPREELFTPDRLHMNERGYALWRGILAPFVQSGVPSGAGSEPNREY